MTDLSTLSDDELRAGYAQAQSQPRGVRNNNPLNLTGSKWAGQTGADGKFAVFDTPDAGRAAADLNLQAYHTKHGINTVAGVVSRWAPPSDGNDPKSYAATVAGKMGVAPDAPIDLTDPETRQALLGHMAAVETGLPADVAAPIPASDLSKMSDAQLRAAYATASGSAAPSPPIPAPRQVVAPRATGPNPTIAQDAASGFAAPFVALGHDVMNEYRRKTANVKPAASLMDAIKGPAADIGGGFRMAGDVLGLASAPVQAIIRPLARGMNRYGPAPTQAPQLSMQGGRLALSAPRALQGDEAQAMIEGDLNTALSGARPATLRAPAVKLAHRSLDDVKAAKQAAYRAVDASGFRFDPASSEALAQDISSHIEDAGGKELYPKAAAVANRINTVVSKGDLSLTKLDKLRQQVGEIVQKDEPIMAGDLRGKLDAYIDSTNAPEIKQARALHATQMKMEAVQNAVDSADLRAASTYAGGNKNNAARQNIRPLIDPRSSQRIRNFTPDEKAAANQAVRGTAGQNMVRATGKMLDPRGLIGGILQSTLGVGTHGLSVASIPLGMAATEAGNAMTAKNIQKLIDLISTGGVRPGSGPQPIPILQLAGRPGLPIGSPAGLTGFAELAAPLARIPSRRQEKQKDTSRAR